MVVNRFETLAKIVFTEFIQKFVQTILLSIFFGNLYWEKNKESLL